MGESEPEGRGASPGEPSSASGDPPAGGTAPLVSSLTQLVDQLVAKPPGEPPSRWAWLNSPFVVTVVGGLIASVISLSWQHRNAVNEAEQKRQESLRAEKMRAMVSFADEFPASLHRLYRAKRQQLIIKKFRPETTRPSWTATRPVYLGKTYAQLRTEYDALDNAYVGGRMPESFIAISKGLFHDPALISKLDELNREQELLFNVKTIASDEDSMLLEGHHDRCNELYSQILTGMYRELSGSVRGNN